jgi:hypothetical protein
MAKSRVVTVVTDTNSGGAVVGAVKDALRKLRPIGVRFESTEQDNGNVSVKAWIETPEPRAASQRVDSRDMALGTNPTQPVV